MLRISKLTDYAIILMVYIGKNSADTHKASELAKLTNIANPTVSKLLKVLTKANFLTSTRGAAGGYKLSKSVQQISVADIVGTIDGPLGLTECSIQEELCDISKICHLKKPWLQINKVVIETLQNYKLSDLIKVTNFNPKGEKNEKIS